MATPIELSAARPLSWFPKSEVYHTKPIQTRIDQITHPIMIEGPNLPVFLEPTFQSKFVFSDCSFDLWKARAV